MVDFTLRMSHKEVLLQTSGPIFLGRFWRPFARWAVRIAIVGFSVLTVFAFECFAESPEMARSGGLWRFEFDNDVFTGSDNAFTAGASLQYHSPLFESWGEGRGAFVGSIERWLGRSVPGLGDDGGEGRLVRDAFGLSHQIFTPDDISDPDLQPDDMPWAGVVGINVAMSSFDNRQLGAIQFYVGCMGPCSGAEAVQRFVHDDLGRGNSPAGWANQLDTKWLANLNYAYRRKLWIDHDEAYNPGQFARDLAVGGQIAVGNYFTFVDAQVEFRFGWGLPIGFTHILDPPARGISLDPVFVPEFSPPRRSRWRSYFSAVLRASAFARIAPVDGGATENGGFHPGIDSETTPVEIIVGAHLAKLPFIIHASYYHYIGSARMLGENSSSSLNWANISIGYRF